MSYPEPEKSVVEPIAILKLSMMQASHLLNILERTKPESSSENAHIKMTVDELIAEMAKIKNE